MRPGHRLTTHQYDQRLDEIADAFAGLYGQVQYGHVESKSGALRKMRVQVDVPGYGSPALATLVFIEKHIWSRDAWERFEYLYDLHMEPRPSGRCAYHWHDDVPHRHCVDPTTPRPDSHYDDRIFDDIGDSHFHGFRGGACPRERDVDHGEVDVRQLADAHAAKTDATKHDQADH